MKKKLNKKGYKALELKLVILVQLVTLVNGLITLVILIIKFLND